MQGTLRTAHLVVGAIAVGAFLVTASLLALASDGIRDIGRAQKASLA